MAVTVASSSVPTSADSTTLDEARSGASAYLQSRLSNKSTSLDDQFEIPIIDISPSFSPSLSDRQAVAEKIRSACISSGFFYITSHGVPLSTCSGILHEAERFFKTLPKEKKELMHLRNSKLGHGWEPSEYTSIAGDVETKEGFNWGYEEGLDKTGGDGKYVNLDGTTYKGNFWPEESDLPGFYAVVRDYYSEVRFVNDFFHSSKQSESPLGILYNMRLTYSRSSNLLVTSSAFSPFPYLFPKITSTP